MDWLLDLTRAIEATGIAREIRVIPWLYPLLKAMHILGIALMFGIVTLVDLRMLGLFRGIPIATVMRLLSLACIGFAIIVLTGVPMLTATATTIARSYAAPWKFGLILLGGANVLIFHLLIHPKLNCERPICLIQKSAKMSAIVSLLTWSGAIIAGRFLAYI